MNGKTMWGKTWLCALSVAILAGSTRVAQAQNDMAGDARSKNAQMLLNTLSEEKTEINTLAAQQAQFKKMGGRENLRLAALWGRWIRDHKAAGPTLMRLARKHGGDPNQAKILKPPALGTQEQMLNATHKDHEMSVMTSQLRHGTTTDPAIKRAMQTRASIARKHLRQMAPYHKMHHEMMHDGKMGNKKVSSQNAGSQKAGMQKVAMTCPHCNVKMVNGKCPSCGMTMQQMKGSMKM
ncbi:MAG: hypothetical protein JWN98_884 [Abditibacteriota bacterium]|jgi:rubrerythrin|nr:hypothetical protein [Abditibacteriota bacterium]